MTEYCKCGGRLAWAADDAEKHGLTTSLLDIEISSDSTVMTLGLTA